ncbi:MAG: helix-turn-helix domain-containing protein [Gemmataceae bacterium]
MRGNQEHRQSTRTPEDAARLRAEREKYQRERPTMEQLLASGDFEQPVPLGEVLELSGVAAEMKQERERQGVTLAVLADRTGIDQATLSKLESGKNDNPTLSTLCRVAAALGKSTRRTLMDTPAQPPA